MDRITLIDKGIEVMTRFAAPSILTGFFVAAVPGMTRAEAEQTFTNPGTIVVHNMDDLYADATYAGYSNINEIREQPNETIVILDKGAT